LILECSSTFEVESKGHEIDPYDDIRVKLRIRYVVTIIGSNT